MPENFHNVIGAVDGRDCGTGLCAGNGVSVRRGNGYFRRRFPERSYKRRTWKPES